MAGIEAIEWSLPSRILSNRELQSEYPDWDFARLEQRTGVLNRHVAAEGETALDLALEACRKLDAAGQLRAPEIDAVIFCTQSPDHVMPPNACLLHGALDLKRSAMAFDITLACSGYIYGLQLADSLVRSGSAKRVLLATADTYTRYINPADRATRVLFGDGAAATLISNTAGSGIRSIRCGTSGKHWDKFYIPAGGMRMPRTAETAREQTDRSGNIRSAEDITMDGMGVLSFFNSVVPPAVREMLAAHSLTIGDIDLFVFHQASQLALDSLRTALAIPQEKMLYDLRDTGNLVSASIPVALARALASGRIRRGQTVLLCGFGVGLSWGTALVDL